MVIFNGLIYCATSPSNKKYYGMTLKSLEERKSKHILNMLNGSNLLFYNALRKHGPDNFLWETIESHSSVDKKELIFLLYAKEIFWIEKDQTYKKEFGYNISHGGSGSDIYNNLSDERKLEIREIISLGVKNKWKEETYRKKLIDKRNTPEYRKKQSNNAKKQWKDLDIREKSIKSFRKDIWDNPERNKKISDKLKNKPKQTCKYCGFQTNSAPNMKRWHNENCKQKP